jgi:hypothetical protein
LPIGSRRWPKRNDRTPIVFKKRWITFNLQSPQGDAP